MLNLPEHKLYSDEYFQYHSIPLIHIFEIGNMLFYTRSVDLVMVKVTKTITPGSATTGSAECRLTRDYAMFSGTRSQPGLTTRNQIINILEI